MRVEVMRDGKSSEAVSFIHSGMGTRASIERDDEPAVSAPPIPPAAESPAQPESPVSSARSPWTASFTEPPASAFAAVRADAVNGRGGMNLAPLRPGDPGYVPAPKTYQVP
jgi:hypothetical protein